MNPTIESIAIAQAHIQSLIRKGKTFHGFAISDAKGNLSKTTFGEYLESSLHPLYSVTKSITAWMALLALQVAGLDANEPVHLLLSRSDFAAHLVKNKYLDKIQVKHLLNMQAGIEWTELDNFTSTANPFQQFLKSDDPIGHLLMQPQSTAPGSEITYNSALSHLLGHCIYGLTGLSLESFTVKHLLEPLQIHQYKWEKDATGQAYGGHGLHLSLNDFTKVAQMIAGQGVYGNQVVLPTAVLDRIRTLEVKGFRGYLGYGNGMWFVRGASHTWVSAFGHRGQRLYWSPDHQVVCTFLGNVRPEFGLQESVLNKLKFCNEEDAIRE